jgi:succinate dehydrogenase/fumarate reductase-like Fe-S protein
MSSSKAIIRIARFGTPGHKSGQFAIYEIPYFIGWSVLDALNYIYNNKDGTLIHPYYCRSGVCAGCLVEVNGKKVLACKTSMLQEMTIRPANERRVARDLIEQSNKLLPKHTKIGSNSD